MIYTYKAAPDIEVLTSDFPIPGFGQVPINDLVLKARVPSWSTPAPWCRARSLCPLCSRLSIPAT